MEEHTEQELEEVRTRFHKRLEQYKIERDGDMEDDGEWLDWKDWCANNYGRNAT
jgi:hypothetical protein